MHTIQFTGKPYKVNLWTILRLPQSASDKLPSRGMTMVEGTINDLPFKAVLEPDGRGSHWFKIDHALQKTAKANAGNTVKMEISPTKEWINPEVPSDMKKALVADKKIHKLWNDITPIARWDWVRWVRGVKTEETRKKHIEVMISKLSKGMRRPCCFNRNMCSDPSVVSKNNWVLRDASV